MKKSLKYDKINNRSCCKNIIKAPYVKDKKITKIETEPIKITNNIAIKDNNTDDINNHDYRHLIFSPSIDRATFLKYYETVIKWVDYALHYLKMPSNFILNYKKINLIIDKKFKKKYTLILDLDGTVITLGNENCYSFKFALDGEIIYIKIRPYLEYLFESIKEHYQIIVFTAAVSKYANYIVDHIDNKCEYICAVLTRQSCYITKNNIVIKDLRVITGIDLDNTVIVDNSVTSFALQLDNGIPILTYDFNVFDMELKYLAMYLELLAKFGDIKKNNSEYFNLKNIINKTKS